MLHSVKLQLLNSMSVFCPKLKVKLLFRKYLSKNLDFENVNTLNEKIQLLKFIEYKNNDLITQCADKFEVRNYVISKGCGDILNKLIFVCDHPSQIPWDILPNKFVIKANHGAGYNFLCHDKSKLNIKQVDEQINSWLNEDFWKKCVEYNYKNIKKKIIGEEFLINSDGTSLDDYKVYCFHGKAHCVMLCIGRENGKPKFVYFDRDFNVLPYSQDSIDLTQDEILSFVKPLGYDDIFKYAEILSAPFKFVRADFYLIEGKVIFGELTFTPSAGLDNERLASTDNAFGEMLDLKK